MLNIDGSSKIFVKGFVQKLYGDVFDDPSECQGEFIALLTDLVVTGHVNVTSVTKSDDGKWILECTDGKVRIFEKEPAAPRILNYGKLVTNFTRMFMEDRYDVVFPDEYEEVAQKIADGDKSYCFVGYPQGLKKQIATSSLIKFWTDPNGKNHGMTLSGSHYVF